jgi:soluble P-type ATPase
MALIRKVPGVGEVELHHLLLDLNGTITAWGWADPRLRERLLTLTRELDAHLLSADTYGTLDRVAAEIGVSAMVVADGEAKLARVFELGANGCVAIGNGSNDAKMLEAARIGIAIVGPEGASTRALGAADVACTSILDALDLLIDESGLAATLRP